MANLKIKLNVDDSELRRKVTDKSINVRLHPTESITQSGVARSAVISDIQREKATLSAVTGVGAASLMKTPSISKAAVIGTSLGAISSVFSKYFERISTQITKSLVTSGPFSRYENRLFKELPSLKEKIDEAILENVLSKIKDSESVESIAKRISKVRLKTKKSYFTSFSDEFKIFANTLMSDTNLSAFDKAKYLTSSFLIGLPGEIPKRIGSILSKVPAVGKSIQTLSGAISGTTLAIRSYFESISNMLKPLKTLTTASISGLGAAATFAATQLQSYFNYLQNLSESTRDVFGNLNISELTTADRQAIEKILLDVSKQFGVQINELMQGVAGALPNLVEKTPANIRWLAEIFAKLKKLENISPEQFQQLSQIAVVSGEDFEAVAQAFNILTDNVGQGASEILQQLRRLSDNMQLADLFPLIEIFSKFYASPREAITMLQSALQGYNEFISGTSDKVNENTKQLLQIMNSDLFRQTQSKYVKFSESLSDSFRQLVSATPTIEIGETFKKISEKVNQKFLESYSPDKLEKLFQTVDRMITRYFPVELQPFAYRLYFNEQGQPTFLLSMSVLADKVIDRVLPVLNNILKTIERMLELVRLGTDKLQIPQTSQRIQYMQQQNPLSGMFGNLR